jgi:hypothetical protein
MPLPLVEAASPMIEKPERRKSGPGLTSWLVWLASGALLIWLLVEGHSYYTTPYVDRPHHPDYRVFRPAGTMGLLFGYAGAAMMVLMLVYSIRKRTRLLGQKVSLQSLLRFHIYLGIMGPLLIVLHTSFKVQGLVAVSFWSMVAVAASGFFGRYLYLQIPRNIEGTELTLQELERLKGDMTAQFRNRFRLDDGDVARLEEVTTRFVSGFQGGRCARWDCCWPMISFGSWRAAVSYTKSSWRSLCHEPNCGSSRDWLFEGRCYRDASPFWSRCSRSSTTGT